MSDDRAAALFEKLRDTAKLPTIQPIVARILELTHREDSKLADVATLLAAEPALATRVLRFVNSPLLGFARRVSSVQHAVSLLGLRGVHMAALGLSLVGTGRDASAVIAPGFDLQRHWARSLISAAAAKSLARQTGKAPVEEAFIAGMLARLGQLALAVGLPEDYGQVLEAWRTTASDLGALERDRFGTDHLALGARLLESWHLPDVLVSAIESIDDVGEGPVPEKQRGDLPRVLHVADLFARLATDPAERTGPRIERAGRVAAAQLGVTEDAWERLVELVCREWKDTLAILNVDPAEGRWLATIQTEAQSQLAELLRLIKSHSPPTLAQEHDAYIKAATDRPTGFGNRAAFAERIDLELERARRTGEPLALALVSIEGHRKLLDESGAAAADQLLGVIAQGLRAITRKVDFLARTGENELAVIFAACDPESAEPLADRIRRAIGEASIEWRQQTVRVRGSVGVAWLRFPDRPRTVRELIDAADAQLYAARRAGGDAARAEPGPTPREA